MKYTVVSEARSFSIEIEGTNVTVNGAGRDATLHRRADAPFAIIHSGGAVRGVVIHREGDGWVVEMGGERVVFQVLDEHARETRDLGISRPSRVAGGIVRAPMPGLVLRVDVAPGDRVQAGGGLLVLEAMKMENEIRAPGAGVVQSILVKPGQAVEKGTPLLELSVQG